MPSKKKKYNARFPAGRIKKIMQTDEEVGKVAQAVPVIISRTLELFVESLLTKSMQITQARSAKTLTPSHMKQCILSESRFDFLKDLVKNIPDASAQEDNENNMLFDTVPESQEVKSSSPQPQTSQEQGTSRKTSTVIRYGPAVTQSPQLATSSRKVSECESGSNFRKRLYRDEGGETDSDEDTSENMPEQSTPPPVPKTSIENVPPLIPIASNFYLQNRSDSLVIDEDYDN